MRRMISLSVLLFLLNGCNELARKPDYQVTETTRVSSEFSYEVETVEASPELVRKANASVFERRVKLGGDTRSAIRNVPEASLFSRQGIKANYKSAYTLGVGDRVSVLRFGNLSFASGVETRNRTETTYTIDEQGALNLSEGRRVRVEGLTLEEAQSAVISALETTGLRPKPDDYKEKPFPNDVPKEYRLGQGDVIKISRLLNVTDVDRNIEQVTDVSLNKITRQGVLSILGLGDFQVAGQTLTQVREQVAQVAVRETNSTEIVVDIDSFGAKKAIVLGDFKPQEIQITDKPESFDSLLVKLELQVDGGRDYLVRLERAGTEYQTTAKTLLLNGSGKDSFLFPEDRITVTELPAETQVSLRIVEFASRHVSYLRIRTDSSASTSRSQQVAFTLSGLDLRQLLIGQHVDLDRNKDLLVRLYRNGKDYTFSAKEIVLDRPNVRYWLQPGDHVVVEDIAYVGDKALLVGELRTPRALDLNRLLRTTLSDALFEGSAFSATDADFKHIYVFRGADLKFRAYHFDISQILNLTLAEDFELRPGDIVFVRTRPLARYNRALTLALTFLSGLDAGLERTRNFGE